MSRGKYVGDTKFEKGNLTAARTCYLPSQMVKALDTHAERLQLSVAALIMLAIGNELASDEPFNYKEKLPPIDESLDISFNEEAKKIYAYMNRTPDKHYSRDNLVSMRFYIGIKSQIRVIRGIEELVRTGLVTEFTPPMTKNGFEYDESYKVIKIVKIEVDFKQRDKRIKRGYL